MLEPAIPAFLDRIKLTYTFTNLNCYENICPHQFWHRYVLKDVPFVSTPAMEFGNQVHEAFDLRISGGKPLPAQFQKWEQFVKPLEGRQAKCEMKVAITEKAQPCDYFDNKVAFMRGKIDVALVNGNTAVIVDWKTGKSKFSTSFELELHAMMLKCKMTNLTSIKGMFGWLAEDRMGEIYDLSQFRQTWDKTQDIIKRISADRQSGQFEKRKSGLCGYCPCSECENWYEAKK